MIYIKSAGEVEKMRQSGLILAECFEVIKPYIKPGIKTSELDKITKEHILSKGAKPSFLNYAGFPGSICASVNDVVIHGIPGSYELKEGDIISLDVGVLKDGFHTDACRTFAVGEISPEAKRLMDVTEQSFFEGMKYAKAGNHLHDISAAIDAYVSSFGYGIVRDLVGHGIGTSLHEEPQIPNFRQWRRGIKLQPGMTLAIEPMVNMGDYDVEWLDDDWTVVTADGSLSAHYENTILITDGEPEILTLKSL